MKIFDPTSKRTVFLRLSLVLLVSAIGLPSLRAQTDGNFVSTADDIGVNLNKHLSLNAGYQLGSRLNVKADSKKDRLGLSLTQKGHRRSRGVVLAGRCRPAGGSIRRYSEPLLHSQYGKPLVRSWVYPFPH